MRVKFVIGCISLAFGEILCFSQEFPRNNVMYSDPVERDDCKTSPDWQATQSAWITADTDSNAASWWQNVSLRSHDSFTNEIGEAFGTRLSGVECGIGAQSTCILPACSNYQNNLSPAWSYELTLGVVNLNNFFNALYTGIASGQADYQAFLNGTRVFFPWKPNFRLGDAASSITHFLTTLFVIPSTFSDVAVKAGPAAAGVGAFVAAGVQQVNYTLRSPAIASQLKSSRGLAEAGKFTATVGSAMLTGIEEWANSTFSGSKDFLNKTILDYLNNGSFANNTNLPNSTQIDLFYKQQMISREINAQWKTRKVFLMFHKTNNTNDTSGPSESRYYSATDGGVYYLYLYSENGILQGHLDKPWGLDYLNRTLYSIKGVDITKASARAFRIGGFNYNQSLAQKRILSSISSNETLDPFADGAGWEGTWTLPVCDTGNHNWNTQYGNKSTRYGMLPCCCGVNCTDTAAFIKAENMKYFQTLTWGCRAQLAHSGIKFKSINYGYSTDVPLPLRWHTWPNAGQVLSILAIIILMPLGWWVRAKAEYLIKR